jgi:hypothetical protein
MITIAFQTYVFFQLASCAHSHYLTAVLVEHRPRIAGGVVVRGVNQTVTRHKMTNLSFSPQWKHVFPELLTWLLTTYFQRTCSVPASRKTRPYVSGFPLGCCDHRWAKWKETIILVRSNVNPMESKQAAVCLRMETAIEKFARIIQADRFRMSF